MIDSDSLSSFFLLLLALIEYTQPVAQPIHHPKIKITNNIIPITTPIIPGTVKGRNVLSIKIKGVGIQEKKKMKIFN